VPSAPSVTSADTLPELRSELAILRRPQLAADKLPAWGIAAEQRQNCSACLNVAKVMPRETRLLTTIRIPRSHAELGRGPERIYLVVGSVPRAWGDGRISGWRQRGRAIDGLHLSLVGITSKHSPSAQPIDEVLNSVSLPVPAQTLNPRVVIITEFATVGVVPDGVTRVKWELDNPGQGTPITVYPRVHGNVAITPWTPAPRSTSLINEQNLAGATWYGPDGRVIATFSVGSSLIDKAHSASGP
jgi:hypothetical protein